MNVNFIPRLNVHRTFGPIVAGTVGEKVALGVKGGTGNGSLCLGESLEALLVVLIPKVDDTVTSNGRKCAVLPLESNTIDRVDVGIMAMTLERKRLLAGYFLQVVNTNSAFDTAHSKAVGIRKARNAPRLVFQRRVFATELARLLLTVVCNNLTTPRSDHEQIVFNVHVVYLVGQIKDPNGVLLPGVPEFQFRVPSARYNKICAAQKAHALDRCIVSTNLLWDIVGRVLSEFPHANGLVTATRENGAAISTKASRENGCFIFVVDCTQANDERESAIKYACKYVCMQERETDEAPVIDRANLLC